MQFEITQKLVHIEPFTWTDKKTNETKKTTLVHFADAKTNKVTKFSFVGDVSILEIQTNYILGLEYYTSPRGSGVSLKKLTPTK